MKETDTLKSLRGRFDEAAAGIGDKQLWNEARVRFLGKKSEINGLMRSLRELAPEEKKTAGKEINALKQYMEERLSDILAGIGVSGVSVSDPTLPGRAAELGREHPLTTVTKRIEEIFVRMGFQVKRGPEVESEWHCFDALNIPESHPARDEQDTFYVDREKTVLRTHTSPVQIRTMLAEKPPIYMIAPGRVYRSDVLDASHSPVFRQVESLAVDKGISFGDLKGVIYNFLSELFGSSVKTRFDNSFFPFTEPSAEVYMGCFCGGKGCSVCKGSGWLEIGGAGMVDPEVFRSVGIDPEAYSGFAFGFGIERMAMLMYGVPDIRYFYENDLRMLRNM